MAARSQTVFPVARSIARTMKRCGSRSSDRSFPFPFSPFSGAPPFFSLPASPTGTAVETKMRSPQTTGDALPRPGIATFQTMPFAGLQETGGVASGEIPFPVGPRQWCQLPVPAAAAGAGSDAGLEPDPEARSASMIAMVNDRLDGRGLAGFGKCMVIRPPRVFSVGGITITADAPFVPGEQCGPGVGLLRTEGERGLAHVCHSKQHGFHPRGAGNSEVGSGTTGGSCGSGTACAPAYSPRRAAQGVCGRGAFPALFVPDKHP